MILLGTGQIRGTSVLESQAAFDPAAFWATRWDSQSDPVGSTLTTGGDPRSENDQLTTAAGLRRRTTTGGRMELSERVGFQDTHSNFFVPDPQAEFARQLQSHLLEICRACWGLFLKRSLLVQKRRSVKRTECQQRAGVATLWLILMLPVVFLMLVFAVEIGNLWLARVELENSLESAALAAVKEWGDSGAAPTLTSRQVGQTFAAADTVRGSSVAIGLNHNVVVTPNENTATTGATANLIFGAITSTSPTVVFNSTVAPGCGSISTTTVKLLADATSLANMQQNDAWGLNFQPAVGSNLTITEVRIKLQTGTDGNARFDNLIANDPIISNNVNPDKVALQDDVVGLSNAALVQSNVGNIYQWTNGQVTFVWNSTNNQTQDSLIIRFAPQGLDGGFQPGDRIRFGARVRSVSTGGNDGDGMGGVRASITVLYSNTGVPQTPVVGTYINSNFGNTGALHPPALNPLIAANLPYVLPLGVSALPDDEQSYVEVPLIESTSGGGGGGGAGRYAVRAGTTKSVTPICPSVCWGPFSVQAHTTAVYDCATGYPSIIRVDQFIFP